MTLTVPEDLPFSNPDPSRRDREENVASSQKPMRSDAQQNRRQLIEVARDAYVTSGDISMTAIAKQAGVGPGTLYRHFPTREALVLAVYRHEIERLADLAPELLDSHPPLEALRLWFDRLAYYGQMKYGVAEVIHAGSSQGAEREAYELIIEALRTLLDAGARAGVLRPNLDADDVLLMVAFLWRIDPSTGGEERAARMLDLVMEGLIARD